MKLSKLGGIVVFTSVCLVLKISSAVGEVRELIVIGENNAPYEFIQGEQVVGINIDVVRHVFKEMGIPVAFAIKPWRRVWANVESGKADAVLSTSRKQKRENFLLYPKEDMWVSEFVFFTKKTKLISGFKGYETAAEKRYRIGIVSGNSYHQSFWKAFPYKNGATRFQGDLSSNRLNDQLDAVPSFETNLIKLTKGRIDLVISDRVVGTYTAKMMGLQDQVGYYEPPLYTKGYPMPFIKRSTYPGIEKVAKRFERELRTFKKTKGYRLIMEKWLN